MQPALHTHPQSGNAHEHKSTKALAARLSTVHNTAAAIFPVLMKQCVLLGAFMAGADRGWLSGRDHVYVTGYVGQIT